MRRLALLLVGLALVGVAWASSSSEGMPLRVQVEGPIGKGANRYWLYRPAGHVRAVVVFLHGLHVSELTPANHRPWLLHLAQEGNAVVYPQYEQAPGTFGANWHTEIAVNAALRRLGVSAAPLVAIGYSRGARLAVEWAAVAHTAGRWPRAVMSVFPGLLNPTTEELIDLRNLDPATQIEILVGQADQRDGGRELLRRLELVNFPPEHIHAVLVHSTKGFVADHFSVFQTSAAARHAFWDRADRLVKSVS